MPSHRASHEKVKKGKNKYEEQLSKWNNDLEKFETNLRKTKTRAKVEEEDVVERLRSKIDLARKKAMALKDAGADTIDSLKEDLELIWSDVKEGFEKIAHKLRH